jgi:energy-coupling factor transport system permease protein
MKQRQVNLFRYIDSDTPVHRMWAGTKLACLAVLSFSLLLKPTAAAIAVVAVVATVVWRIAHIPRGAFGGVPGWFFIGLGLAAFFSVIAFGPPEVRIVGYSVGLGGTIIFLRFTSLGFALLSLGLLLGWTTQLADIGGAVDRLASPARFLRLPVDEVVLAIGLSVRCLPLLTEDVRTLRAAWRVRAPVRKMNTLERLQEVRDLLVAVMVSSLRRAREMGDAIEARGGAHLAHRPPWHFGAPDAGAVALTAVAATAIWIV